MLNPDGWMYVVDEDLSNPWWRKNLHDNDSNGVFDPLFDGVDLNQNYDINWEHGINDPSSWEYRGPDPFSEKETQAKRDLALEQKFVMSLTYHSYGEAVYYLHGSLGTPAPDAALYLSLATEVASRIPKVSGGTYDLWEDSYCEGGYSDCWMYLTQGTFEFTVETAPSFIPNGSQAITIAHDNINGAMYLFERINGPGITGHITDVFTGEPLEAEIKVLNYDNETITPRISDSMYGRYTRLLQPATYSFEFSKDGYYTETISDLSVGDQSITWLDVQLTPDPTQQQEDVFLTDHAVKIIPNPVNSTAEIRYQKSDINNVKLTVYDAYGRLIETLVDEVQQPGEYVLRWNAENLPSGIYIYRLTASDEVASGKIVVK
jgi:hypothetical protein